MIGITLSPDQIRAAPPEVRRWLEQQIGTMFGLGAPPEPPPEAHDRLIVADLAVIRAILAVIQKLPPVVQVFFDLAREPAAPTGPGIRVLRVADIMRNCHLQAPEQVVACIDTINEAVRRIAGNPDVAVALLDDAGHCLVPDATARNILAVWQDMVGAHRLDAEAAAPVMAATPPPVFAAPYATSIPASAINAEPPGPR